MFPSDRIQTAPAARCQPQSGTGFRRVMTVYENHTTVPGLVAGLLQFIKLQILLQAVVKILIQV